MPSYASQLTVYDASGALVRTVDATTAQAMVAEKIAIPRGSKSRYLVLILSKPVEVSGVGARRLPKQPPESHCSETLDNPRGVWTLRRHSAVERQIFCRPLIDCAMMS